MVLIHKDGKTFTKCKGCGKEKELTKDNFEPHPNTKSGFLGTCRICRSTYKTNRNKKTKDTDIIMSIEDTTPLKTTPAPKIKLDLTDIVNKYPELYEELAYQAEDRMRPIEHHALWLIKVAMDMATIEVQKV